MDVLEWMWGELQDEIQRVSTRVDVLETRSERAETVGGFPAYTYENRPLAATGGMSDGSAYIDIIWISNARKAAEGVGLGTGQLCYYDAAIDGWRLIRDDSVVTA